VLPAAPAQERDRVLSWLPLSGLYQRMLNLWALCTGANLHYLADPRRLPEALQCARPTLMAGVPSVFEKIVRTLENRGVDSRRGLRAFFGGSLRFALTGSAPCPLWLLETYHR